MLTEHRPKSPLASARGGMAPVLPASHLPGRIETYGRADRTQDLQVHTPAHPQTGEGNGVCRAPLPRPLQRGGARAPRRLADARGEPHCRQSERPTAGDQGSPARISRPPLPGVARRAHAAGSRVSGVLPPGEGGGETPGYPRFQGRDRCKSFTSKQFGNGATLDNGFLVLSKIGRIAVRCSRPLEGTPKTVTISREADGYYVCFSCVDVPVQPLAPTGQETGIDLGLEAFATMADGVP